MSAVVHGVRGCSGAPAGSLGQPAAAGRSSIQSRCVYVFVRLFSSVERERTGLSTEHEQRTSRCRIRFPCVAFPAKTSLVPRIRCSGPGYGGSAVDTMLSPCLGRFCIDRLASTASSPRFRHGEAAVIWEEVRRGGRWTARVPRETHHRVRSSTWSVSGERRTEWCHTDENGRGSRGNRPGEPTTDRITGEGVQRLPAGHSPPTPSAVPGRTGGEAASTAFLSTQI